MSRPKYARPEEAMTTSAQAAHYLHFCHQNRPGERIKYTEVAQVTSSLPKLPRSDHSKVKALRLSTSHIRNALRSYKLGMHTNKDGILVLATGDDVTKYEVIPRAAKLEAARRGLEKPLTLAEGMGIRDGQMKRFAAKARGAERAIQRELPSSQEIRGLLTSGEDD